MLIATCWSWYQLLPSSSFDHRSGQDIHRNFFPNAKICHRCTEVPGINYTKDDDDDDDVVDVNGNSKSNWNCSNYNLKLQRYTGIDIISWGLHLAVLPKPLSSMHSHISSPGYSCTWWTSHRHFFMKYYYHNIIIIGKKGTNSTPTCRENAVENE